MSAAIPAALAINGAVQGRKSAKEQRAAIQEQRDNEMKSYNFSEPYIQRSYDRSEAALNSSLEAGTYGGKTYADMDPFSTAGNNFMGNAGMAQGSNSFDMANASAGFANNYQDLYDRSSQDRMGAAQEYALGTSQPLIDAAMRDERRQLNEQTLPGINRQASGQGNMNSSRAGIAEAVANRGYQDRYADTSAAIYDTQAQRHMGMQQNQFNDAMSANAGLYQGFGAGMDGINSAGGMMVGAGNNFRNYQQGALNDNRDYFNRNRDFALDQNIKYKKGILSDADYTSSSIDAVEKPNTMMSTIGGFQSGYGMGNDFDGSKAKAYALKMAQAGGGQT